MNEIVHNLYCYLQSPEGILDILKLILPIGTLIYAIKKFSLDYKKPRFNVIKIQSDTNPYSKEDCFCYIKLELFNPASIDNTVYISARSVINFKITSFFGPDDSDKKARIPANGDISQVFHAYTTISREHEGKILRICLSDSKGKVSSKWLRWQSTKT